MEHQEQALNQFLVDVFHEILKSEEQALSSFEYRNLSLREMHVIETVVQAKRTGSDNRATAIASSLRITAGSLTTAITTLEQKGYLIRIRDEKDRRIVHILPTSLGERVDAYHQKYHQEMIKQVLGLLTEEETAVLLKGLSRLSDFFKEN